MLSLSTRTTRLLLPAVAASVILGTSAVAGGVALAGVASGQRVITPVRVTITAPVPYGPDSPTTCAATEVTLSFIQGGGKPGTFEGAAGLHGICNDPPHTMIDATGTFNGTTFAIDDNYWGGWTGSLDQGVVALKSGKGNITLTFRVPAGPAPSPTPTAKAPTVQALPYRDVIRMSQDKFTVSYRVVPNDGPPGKWTVHVSWYSGGKNVRAVTVDDVVPSDAIRKATTDNDLQGSGPFYFCVWATEHEYDGAKSNLSCQWLTREVHLDDVSNGCGTAEWGSSAEWLQNMLGNDRYYGGVLTYLGGYRVIVKQACDVHDAAYAGATVLNPFTSRVVDYRTWTRKKIDAQFRDDIRALCRAQLTTPAERKYLTTCLNGVNLSAAKALLVASGGVLTTALLGQIGALTYQQAVRAYGGVGYDTNAYKEGIQQDPTPPRTPTGAGRDIR